MEINSYKKAEDILEHQLEYRPADVRLARYFIKGYEQAKKDRELNHKKFKVDYSLKTTSFRINDWLSANPHVQVKEIDINITDYVITLSYKGNENIIESSFSKRKVLY